MKEALQNKTYDVIFIPFTLSQQNYLELTGLRVAAHIRVTTEFKHEFVPIVFIGPESPEQIAKLSELGNILFSPGVFHTAKTDAESLVKQYQWIKEKKPKITEKEWEKCLRRLQLSPPANYQSHHSIDNELALLRWSEYLKCDDQIPEVKENIQKGLYFKYQRALNPIEPVNDGKSYLIEGKAKVLLIDDEADKGWKDFYKCFFQHSPDITFDYLQCDFKSLSREEIITNATDKLKNADVVLLDLRLCDKDFNSQAKSEELTGYKILEEIKKINKGIQVIIITASNKVWNYESLLRIGANGYIVKKGDSDVGEYVKDLKESIKKAIKKASFLKVVYALVESLKKHITTNEVFNSDKEDSLRNNLKVNYDISFELLENAYLYNNNKYFNYAYLQLFLCIEEFLNIKSIFEFGDKCYVNQNIKVAEKIKVKEKQEWESIINIKHNNNRPSYWFIEKNSDVTSISTDFKMSCVLIFFFNQENSNCHNWPNIRDVRNKKAGHPGKYMVSKEEIMEILKFQEYIFNKDNLKEPEKKGLPDNIK